MDGRCAIPGVAAPRRLSSAPGYAPVAGSHPRSLDPATGVFLALFLGWAALQIVVEVMVANVMELWQ